MEMSVGADGLFGYFRSMVEKQEMITVYDLDMSSITVALAIYIRSIVHTFPCIEKSVAVYV